MTGTTYIEVCYVHYLLIYFFIGRSLSSNTYRNYINNEAYLMTSNVNHENSEFNQIQSCSDILLLCERLIVV
jgi:hypothetical protein